MELFLVRRDEFERLYNCTGLNIDSVPLEQRQFVSESIVLCILCTIYYALYLPCMYSIWKHINENSCYKLLFFIGITDLANMFVLGYLSAWFSFRGAVFCSHPTLIYLAGVAATTFWVAESTADLILALNRCLELSCPRFAHFLFLGPRTNFWTIGCSLYALYWAVFVKPVLFNGVFNAWFYNPFAGYRTDNENEYEERLQILQDVGVAVLCPSIYLILAVKLFVDVRKNRQHFGTVITEFNSLQAKIFVQVFLLSMLNTLTGTIYVYMQWYQVDQWAITLAEFAWFHVHGFPPVIYWALNKTISEDCRMLYMKLFYRSRVSHISGVTVLRAQSTLNPAVS